MRSSTIFVSVLELVDRKSMLELIEVTADTLLVFDTLSPELRANLSDGLKEVVNVLRPSKGFLPRGRGKRSEEESRGYQRSANLTRCVWNIAGIKMDLALMKPRESRKRFWCKRIFGTQHYNLNKAYLGARRVFEMLKRIN